MMMSASAGLCRLTRKLSFSVSGVTKLARGLSANCCWKLSYAIWCVSNSYLSTYGASAGEFNCSSTASICAGVASDCVQLPVVSTAVHM
jgi:hypothetical protein